jgi:hypothetical protein
MMRAAAEMIACPRLIARSAVGPIERPIIRVRQSVADSS